MLKKVKNLEVNSDNPFRNDRLNRKEDIEFLTSLINTLSESFVISINAPWGTGKSTFLKMWEKYLENQEIKSIYFNAWENSFINEPLIALIGEISEFFVECSKKNSNLLRQIKKLKDNSPYLIKQNSQIIGEELFQEHIKAKIENYSFEKELHKNFKNDVAEFAKIVIDDKKPFVIFIDELDRCRPHYAIELLEMINHYFSVENIVFVLAVDKVQLLHSIEMVYGNGMDSNGYLRRFIDLDIKLPKVSAEVYINYLVYEKFKLDKLNILENKIENLANSMSLIANIYSLSLREIEQCLIQINMLIRTKFKEWNISGELLGFLITFRVAKPEMYAKFISKEISGKEIIKELKKKNSGKEFLKIFPNLEVFLLSVFLDFDQYNILRSEYKSMAENSDISQSDKAKAKEMFEIFNMEEKSFHTAMPRYVKEIELIDKYLTN